MLERNDMILRGQGGGYGDRAPGAMMPYSPQGMMVPPPMMEESESSLFGSIFRHLWIVILVLALSLGSACVYLSRAEQLYTSTSRIYIEPQAAGPSQQYTGGMERGSYLFTQCEMIKSTPILSKLLETPDVKALPVFSQIPDQLWYLRKHLEAEVGRRDDIINVSVETPRAEESAVLVNKLIETFVTARNDQAEKGGSTVVQAMQQRLKQMEQELGQTRKQSDALVESDPNLQLNDGRDNPQARAMGDALVQRNQAELALMQAQMTWGANSKQVQNLQQLIERLDTQYRDLKKEALANGSKQRRLEALRVNERELQARMDPLRTQLNQLELNERIRQQIVPVQVYEVGVPIPRPSSPKSGQTLGLAAIIGVVLGGMLALIRDKMDNRLRTIEEVQSIVGLPILGVIPRMPGRRTAVARAMAVHLDPRSEVSEAYRTVRTAVYFGAGSGSRAKTLLVTSPEPGDGKTTSASNLAIAIAQTGRNILLLDADFRKPTQHKNLDVKDSVGLSSVLAGIETLERAIQRTGVEGLDILPCGPIPENPSEILNSQEFGELIDRLALKYDHILFDSPPSNLVTDARILGAVCDASILVLRAEKSTRKAAEHARNAMLSVGANLLGVIVNDVPRGKGYEVYGGSYYGMPESRNRSASADYAGAGDTQENPDPLARLPKPASEVSD